MSSSGTVSQRLPTVLVVDDDAGVRALVRAVLEDVATLLEASDGDEALSTLERYAGSALDLVLIDHVLPKRSGLELLRLSRQRWPWIPLIVITGYGSEELAIQVFRAGASDYLRKPLDVRQFRRSVLSHARPPCSSVDVAGTCVQTSAGSFEKVVVTHRGIARAVTFVREHFTEPMTLSQVAEEARLSRFHFCRLFHGLVGISFREYVHALRIERAKTLLGDPGQTVTEVAYESGFHDLSHFDRVFNRVVGVSPTAYRRMHASPGNNVQVPQRSAEP